MCCNPRHGGFWARRLRRSRISAQFSCRTIAGRRSMSEHATANAFDISGFKTKSGKLISVKRDWGKATPDG